MPPELIKLLLRAGNVSYKIAPKFSRNMNAAGQETLAWRCGKSWEKSRGRRVDERTVRWNFFVLLLLSLFPGVL